MKLEEKLVALRKEKGLSQLKLAEMMNVSRQAISRWEVGAAAPSTENLKYLGALYHVPLEYLLNEDAPEPVRTDADSSQETEPHEGTGKQNTRTMILLLTAVGIFAVILCAIVLGNPGGESISMGNLEGSDIETVNDFKLDW